MTNLNLLDRDAYEDIELAAAMMYFNSGKSIDDVMQETVGDILRAFDFLEVYQEYQIEVVRRGMYKFYDENVE